MRAFDIDFARRRPQRWMAPAFLAASALALILSWNYFAERRDLVRAQEAEQRRQLQELGRPRPADPQELKRADASAQELQALQYPWRSVFEVLEAAGAADLKVVSFAHDRASGRSQIVLQAARYDSIDAALTRMKKNSPAGVQWSIESVSRESSGAAPGVRVTLIGRW